MSETKNHLGQAIGEPIQDWVSRPSPPRTPMEGRWCRLTPLSAAKHAAALHEAYAQHPNEGNWTYLPYGPFPSADAYAEWVNSIESCDDPIPFAILSIAENRPAGVASYLRIDPAQGPIEVGHLNYSPTLQRTTAATEAMYLMMRRAFDELGYRRYEWRCDSHNVISRCAAERLGFRYEGTFRQAMVMKGRNRNTAWFSIIDREWPAVRAALEQWLDPSNFDGAGHQRQRLETFSPKRASV